MNDWILIPARNDITSRSIADKLSEGYQSLVPNIEAPRDANPAARAPRRAAPRTAPSRVDGGAGDHAVRAADGRAALVRLVTTPTEVWGYPGGMAEYLFDDDFLLWKNRDVLIPHGVKLIKPVAGRPTANRGDKTRLFLSDHFIETQLGTEPTLVAAIRAELLALPGARRTRRKCGADRLHGFDVEYWPFRSFMLNLIPRRNRKPDARAM
jgi:hypothetical protein